MSGAPWGQLWRARRSILAWALALVLTLALVDGLLFQTNLFVNLASTRLSDTDYPRVKLLLARAYTDSTILFLGDSRVLTGINPADFTEACACGRGYNGAVAAADTRLTRLIESRLLQTLSPKVAVVGLSYWELSDVGNSQSWQRASDVLPPWRLREYDPAMSWRDLPWHELIRSTVADSWRLFRFHVEIRRVLEARSAQKDGLRGFHPVNRQNNSAVLDPPSTDMIALAKNTFPDRHSRRYAAFEQLVTDLRARRMEVVLIGPPVTRPYWTALRSELDVFSAEAQRIATRHGALFLDFRTSAAANDFYDPTHLNEDGARKFSRYLGSVVRQYLATR